MSMDTETAPSQPAAPVVVTATRRSNRVLDLALAGAAVLAIGGVAFAIGRGTAPAATPAGFVPGGAVVRGSFDPGAGPNGPGRGVALGGNLSIDGTVTAVDADSLTVKLADGSEMTFDLDSSTAYHEASDASSSDVAVGDDVSVKVSGEDRAAGGQASEAPSLSASDVTVAR
jgi:hypothetical protein